MGVSTYSLQQHNVSVDVVELDPIVPEFAVKYFYNLNLQDNLFICDGKEFLREKSLLAARNEWERYDFVVHDIFSGGMITGELLSPLVFEDIKNLLKADGILALVKIILLI